MEYEFESGPDALELLPTDVVTDLICGILTCTGCCCTSCGQCTTEMTNFA